MVHPQVRPGDDVYVALVAGTAYALVQLPEGFLPVEDQGFFTVDVQTPPGASFNGP